jgi:transcriptional regulator with XRE-family HTH domain
MASDPASEKDAFAVTRLSPEDRVWARALGQRLKHYRSQTPLTQHDLALFSGVSVRHVVRIEQGRTTSRRSTLRHLVSVLVEDMPEIGDVDEITAELVAIGGHVVKEDGSPLQLAAWRNRAEKLSRLVLDGFTPDEAWRIVNVLRGT